MTIKLTDRRITKRPAKPKLVPTTQPSNPEAPCHHFFVSSMATWRTGYDLEALIKAMKAEGYPFNVFMVPGAKDTNYSIQWFAPQVEGTVWLAMYALEGAV